MANPAPFEIKRHHSQSSERDADAMVQAVVGLIVACLKQRGGLARSQAARAGTVGNGPSAAGDAIVGEYPTDE